MPFPPSNAPFVASAGWNAQPRSLTGVRSPLFQGMTQVTSYRTQSGVTLIELMVAIAVLAILLALAAPSFADLAERSALRGAADNVVGVIAAAREESIKRDQWVRVDFKEKGDGFCVGAAAVDTVTSAGCDCSTATCALASFPEAARDLHRVTLTGNITFGDDAGSFVIDPKTGTLSDFDDGGFIEMGTAHGYAARVGVNAMGRASICTSGDKSLPGVAAC